MERILQRRYRIVRSLGRGGLGAVYLCDDLRLPGKQWALKQMHNPDEEMYERFRETFDREASTLSRLRHPNLPVMVDYFEEATECYLVMEYVEGENLAEHVRRRGPLGEREAFARGLVLLDLFTYLHGQTPPLIFRDLKPENVMLTPDNILKLIDFGLARRFVPGKRSDTVPSGSVGYAAPEQWEDLSQTDERSDIYSWGATLVHLVSGKIPSPVFPMSALRGLDVPISEVGHDILDKCLRARPAERYPNVEALAAVVRQHLESLGGTHVEAPPPPSPSRQPVPVQGQFEGGRGSDSAEKRRTDSAQKRRSDSAQKRRSDSEERSRRETDVPDVPLRRAWPVPSVRTLSLPLILLLLATAAFIGAVAAEIPRRSQVASPATQPPETAVNGQSGVGPYKLQYATNPRKDDGKALYDGGKLAAAIEALDQATTQYPDDAEAHILKENAYIKLTQAPSVTIPYIGSMSGVDGPDSYSQMHGLALAQSTINARGGVAGRKVVLDLYDDTSLTSRCLQIAEKLVRDPKTVVVIGPFNSQRTLAIAPLFNAAHVSLVAPVASARKVWESGPYIFSAADSSERRVRAISRWLFRGAPKKVGVIVDETSRLSLEMAKTFADEVKDKNITIVPLPPFQEEALDYTPQVEAIRATHPDFVFFCDYRGNTTAQFARQMREAGLKTPIFSQTIPFTQDLVEAGPAVDGVLLSSYFHPQMDTPRMRAYMAAFRRKFGNLTPTHLAVNTFDSLIAVSEALAKAGDSREGVRDYLASVGTTRPAFDGIAGPFALGKMLDARDVWIIEVRGGRYRLVGKGDAPTAVLPSPASKSAQ